MKHCKTRLSLILIGVVVNLLASLPISAQPAEEDVRKEAEEARRSLELFLREQRVLFRQGEINLELDIFYSMDTGDELRTVVGSIAVPAKITNRSVFTTLIARYGLVNDLELDVEIPFFGYAEEKIDFRVERIQTMEGIRQIERIRTIDDQGLGDIAGRLRYQLWREQGARPDVILDLGGKSPTGDDPLLGTGHWSVAVGITLVKTLDPVVFFGRLGYTFTLKREGGDPGDEIHYSLGMGYSLNDRVSFNMQAIGAYVGQTQRDGKEIPGSSLEILSLQFSVTVLVTRRLFVEPVVNFGLTADAVDVVVGVNVPFQF
jgi:Putative MetA-pathway of phenol degradation